MNVLSLFNGMSFCSMALESLGVNVNKMYSSEIDKYANQATQALFPDTIQLGDITQWREWDIDWASIDLVTGGFPCQAWSMAGKQLGDKDERGMLFWTMLDIMKHVRYHNPKADFLIENVKMKKEFEQYITTHTENALGYVHKTLINSALVSAQNRNRYYWTSFAVEQPEDKGVVLKDVIESIVDDKYLLSEKLLAGFSAKKERRSHLNSGFDSLNIRCHNNKSSTLTARYYKTSMSDPYILQRARGFNGGGVKAINGKTPTLSSCSWEHNNYALLAGTVRKLTPRECFRLQTVPEHHIDTLLSAGISNTQLYKMCGNGWTMEVIKHIFKALESTSAE
tara:strand:- start:432 stop:1445 length:1014 start_codon:yes stop_codon:yes gene_type:complete